MSVNSYGHKNSDKMPIVVAKVSKNGHSKVGKQVYNCNNKVCTRKSFIETYTNKAYQPNVREQVLKMVVDGAGTRATGRILGISKDAVAAIS